MIIFQNKIIDCAFLEKDIDFSLKNGVEIVSILQNCEIDCYFLTLKGDRINLRSSYFPPIDVNVSKIIVECDLGFDKEESLIKHLELKTCPDAKIRLVSRHVASTAQDSWDVRIRSPKCIIGCDKDAEIVTPDGITIKISNSSDNFAWSTNGYLCCKLARGLSYRIRMRGRIDKKRTAWSNWFAFTPPMKRTLGKKSN